MYLVIKHGFYRHDIWGLYTSLDLAKEAATKRLLDELDDYHQAQIIEIHPDVLCEDGTINMERMFLEREDGSVYNRDTGKREITESVIKVVR